MKKLVPNSYGIAMDPEYQKKKKKKKKLKKEEQT